MISHRFCVDHREWLLQRRAKVVSRHRVLHLDGSANSINANAGARTNWILWATCCHAKFFIAQTVFYNTCTNTLFTDRKPSMTTQQTPSAPAPAMSGVNISKRRKFVADGVFYAELNEFFQRELAEEGYSGVEVRVTPTVTDIIIRATHTQEVLGEQGRRIREVSADCDAKKSYD